MDNAAKDRLLRALGANESMRLFLDANVSFSAAHNPSGNAHALFLLARKGLVKRYSSGFARYEAVRNIALKLPHCREALEDLLGEIEQVENPNFNW